MALLFNTAKQHVCGTQEMVLALPLDISVNFTDQKFCRLNREKVEKCLNF